jgi:hypothetical protein
LVTWIGYSVSDWLLVHTVVNRWCFDCKITWCKVPTLPAGVQGCVITAVELDEKVVGIARGLFLGVNEADEGIADEDLVQFVVADAADYVEYQAQVWLALGTCVWLASCVSHADTHTVHVMLQSKRVLIDDSEYAPCN